MDTLPEEKALNNKKLFTGSETPKSFWKLLNQQITEEDWQLAGKASFHHLAGLPVSLESGNLSAIICDILSENQFGPEHWRLKPDRRMYYSFLRPLLPDKVRLLIKRFLRNRLRHAGLLKWPIEDRYILFQWGILYQLMKEKGLDTIPYIHFWPNQKRYAFVLTHDVESPDGQSFVRTVADLEEKYGFRSSFNFVPEEYPVDRALIEELQERGFEVGVHGLKHDGKMFTSKASFLKIAVHINQYLKEWNVVGFRSPLTHRNPEWMQVLNIEYDSSFFDTDPFEPIPGGTMSIWPFHLGHFVELPYTLVQDHSLMVTLSEQTPKIWLEKVNYIKRYCGMALVNSHPDYLRQSYNLCIYEAFLKAMHQQNDFWQALPVEVARWWRLRESLPISKSMPTEETSGVTFGEVHRIGNTIELFPTGA